MPRILPSGTGMLPPSSTQESSGLRELGRACIPARLGPHNLYRDIVQELEEGVDCLGQKAYFESDHCGAASVIRPASPSLI